MKRLASRLLIGLLFACVFTAAFNIRPINVNARSHEPAQVQSAETAFSISWHNTLSRKRTNVVIGQMLLEPNVAFMRPAERDGSSVNLDTPPPANYDEQLGLTFTENFTSIAYNVTAVQQADNYGYGPAYLLSGVTNKGYWYQVGLSFDWPYTSGGYTAGFHFNYEVFNNRGRSIFPASGGGLENFSGQVNSGDDILLKLYFSSSNVAMYAYDWNTGARATITYSAEGASIFQGQTEAPSNANGFFSGLMTEWWHANAYYGNEAQVVYNETIFALYSGWLWADEWVPSNESILFSNYQYELFSNPTQLQYLSTNGASEAASGHLFITGAYVHNVAVTNVISSKTMVVEGNNIYVNITVTNSGEYTEKFNVTIYGSWNGYSWPVYTFTNVTLAPGNTTTLTTAGLGFGAGLYMLSVQVYNAYVNNTYTGVTILVAPIAMFRPWTWHRPTFI